MFNIFAEVIRTHHGVVKEIRLRREREKFVHFKILSDYVVEDTEETPEIYSRRVRYLDRD
jgi:hypothetical protein